VKTGGLIHNITEKKRRERSSLRVANESRFICSNMDEYGIPWVSLCVIWIAVFGQPIGSGGVLALYGAQCRLACGPADATTTHCLLIQ